MTVLVLCIFWIRILNQGCDLHMFSPRRGLRFYLRDGAPLKRTSLNLDGVLSICFLLLSLVLPVSQEKRLCSHPGHRDGRLRFPPSVLPLRRRRADREWTLRGFWVSV